MARVSLAGVLASFLALSAHGVAAETPAEYLARTGILGTWSPNCSEPATTQNYRFSYVVENNVLLLRIAPYREGPLRLQSRVTQASPESAERFNLTIEHVFLQPDGQPGLSVNGRNILNQTWRRLAEDRIQLWRAVRPPGGGNLGTTAIVDVDNGAYQENHRPTATLTRCS